MVGSSLPSKGGEGPRAPSGQRAPASKESGGNGNHRAGRIVRRDKDGQSGREEGLDGRLSLVPVERDRVVERFAVSDVTGLQNPGSAKKAGIFRTVGLTGYPTRCWPRLLTGSLRRRRGRWWGFSPASGKNMTGNRKGPLRGWKIVVDFTPAKCYYEIHKRRP